MRLLSRVGWTVSFQAVVRVCDSAEHQRPVVVEFRRCLLRTAGVLMETTGRRAGKGIG
jgi:hypothetical protein